MNKLFIIGNGFDLAHKINSRYEDFRQYLVNRLVSIAGNKYRKYDFSDSSIITSDYSKCIENDLLTILYFLTVADYSDSLEWKDIENAVGKLNYDEFSWLYIDESDIDKEYRANWINEDIFSPYIKILTEIPNYFKEWVKQVDISNALANDNIKKYFDSSDIFLCFNYTSTLEKVYNIDKSNICYIHGNIDSGNEIYFGHGNNLTYDDYIKFIDNPNYFSVADGYSLINDSLRKPVNKIIENNKVFFEKLIDVHEIYSYGFSYSEVDEPYIKEICKYISCDSKWYINSYPTEEEKSHYKEVITKCGYKNIVKEFN